MGRIQKYRAWNDLDKSFANIQWHASFNINGTINVAPFAKIDQYTGFRDIDNVEIYENDIVAGKPLMGWSDQSRIVGKVFFEESTGIWRVKVVKDDWEDIEYLFELVKNPRHELTVIGNLHKNPELLNNF